MLKLSRQTDVEQVSTGTNEHRILMIYDLSSQPFSVGDILFYQEASLVLRERLSASMVDFALVYDPKNPALPFFTSIKEKNATYHLSSILPLGQVNQYHGSLFLFNSYLHLQRLIASCADLYHAWPPSWQTDRKYQYYTIINDLLYNYYKEHGAIPHLSCCQSIIDWARAFYREHISPLAPVTVQVRNNKMLHTHRNSRLECWLEFFRHCEERYPVKFVVVCSLAEVDDRLRQCPNAIIAKDYHTGIEHDLALIQTAAIHTGASSGPGVIALFNTKPYLFVNTDMAPHLYRGIVKEDGFLRHYFAGPLQRFSVGSETTELLIAEFARMWSAVDVDSWKKQEDKSENDFYSWLR